MALNHSRVRDEARKVNNDLRVVKLQLRRDQILRSGFREARPTIGREPHRRGIPEAILFGCFPFKLRRGPPASGGNLPVVSAVNVKQAKGIS